MLNALSKFAIGIKVEYSKKSRFCFIFGKTINEGVIARIDVDGKIMDGVTEIEKSAKSLNLK